MSSGTRTHSPTLAQYGHARFVSRQPPRRAAAGAAPDGAVATAAASTRALYCRRWQVPHGFAHSTTITARVSSRLHGPSHLRAQSKSSRASSSRRRRPRARCRRRRRAAIAALGAQGARARAREQHRQRVGVALAGDRPINARRVGIFARRHARRRRCRRRRAAARVARRRADRLQRRHRARALAGAPPTPGTALESGRGTPAASSRCGTTPGSRASTRAARRRSGPPPDRRALGAAVAALKRRRLARAAIARDRTRVAQQRDVLAVALWQQVVANAAPSCTQRWWCVLCGAQSKLMPTSDSQSNTAMPAARM